MTEEGCGPGGVRWVSWPGKQVQPPLLFKHLWPQGALERLMKVGEDHFAMHSATGAAAALGLAEGCWAPPCPACRAAAGARGWLLAAGVQGEQGAPSALRSGQAGPVIAAEAKEALCFWQEMRYRLGFNNTGGGEACWLHPASLAYQPCFSLGSVKERWKSWFRSGEF